MRDGADTGEPAKQRGWVWQALLGHRARPVFLEDAASDTEAKLSREKGETTGRKQGMRTVLFSYTLWVITFVGTT